MQSTACQRQSQALANMSAYFSNIRRREEFYPLKGFDWPVPLPSAKHRLQNNLHYFQANYLVFVLICACVSLLNTTVNTSFLFMCVFWFFNIFVLLLDANAHNRKLRILCLIPAVLFTAYLAGILGRLCLGVGVGVAADIAHAFFRNLDGRFLSEEEAVSAGLLAAVDSNSTSSTTRTVMSP